MNINLYSLHILIKNVTNIYLYKYIYIHDIILYIYNKMNKHIYKLCYMYIYIYKYITAKGSFASRRSIFGLERGNAIYNIYLQ